MGGALIPVTRADAGLSESIYTFIKEVSQAEPNGSERRRKHTRSPRDCCFLSWSRSM